MTRILKFDPNKRNPQLKGETKQGGELTYLSDHRFLSTYAKTQGLSYREFREMLREYDMSTDLTVENLKKGIAPIDYVKKRRMRNIRAIGSVAVASIASIVLAISPIKITPPDLSCKDYVELARKKGLDETTLGQTEYYCLVAEQTNPNNNIYLETVRSEKEAIPRELREYYEKYGWQ